MSDFENTAAALINNIEEVSSEMSSGEMQDMQALLPDTDDELERNDQVSGAEVAAADADAAEEVGDAERATTPANIATTSTATYTHGNGNIFVPGQNLDEDHLFSNHKLINQDVVFLLSQKYTQKELSDKVNGLIDPTLPDNKKKDLSLSISAVRKRLCAYVDKLVKEGRGDRYELYYELNIVRKHNGKVYRMPKQAAGYTASRAFTARYGAGAAQPDPATEGDVEEDGADENEPPAPSTIAATATSNVGDFRDLDGNRVDPPASLDQPY